MYIITVNWLERSGQKQVVYSPVKEYELTAGVLTMAFDANHDLVIPLWDVASVDIVRHE